MSTYLDICRGAAEAREGCICAEACGGGADLFAIQRVAGEFHVRMADGAPRLFIGEEVRGEVVYRGTVELGVGPALVAELLERGRRRRTSPFAGLSLGKVTWLEPTIAVDVSYGRVMQGWLREPTCRGLAAAWLRPPNPIR